MSRIKKLVVHKIRQLKSYIIYLSQWNNSKLFLYLLEKRNITDWRFNKTEYSSEMSNDLAVSKNVLFLLHWYELGGAEAYALETIKAAKSRKINCYSISTIPAENKEIQKFETECTEVIDFTKLDANTEFKAFIVNYIIAKNIDTIHIHHSHAMYEVLPYIKKRYPNLKIIDSTHVFEYGSGGFPHLSAQFSDYIDIHDVISKLLIDGISTQYKSIHGKEIQPKKFNLSYLTSMYQAPNSFEKRNVSALRITFYGRFTFQKQPYLFISTIEKLISSYPHLNIRANIYGDGEMKARLKKRINSSKYKSYFNMLGRCDDKEEVFSNTDILFIPSFNEGITLTSYEALMHNVLPVSSNVGAQSELLCEECLIRLDRDFTKNAVEKLHILLTDQKYYNSALEKNLNNLKLLRKNELSKRSFDNLYGKI